MKEKKTIYYSDELNDDFANNNIDQKKLPDDFKYVHKSVFYKVVCFIVYRIIVTPLVSLYVKIKYHQSFKNKRVLKGVGSQGYFIYGNHTNGDLDAFVPTMLAFPKKPYIIVNPDATSIKGIRTLVMMLGAIPLPTGFHLFKRYSDAIKQRVNKEKSVITIYPEAHIWPYYTDVRDFNPASLSYAYENDKPVFCFTNVYVKQRIFKRPRVVTYIDGPFFIDKSLNKKENIAMLKEKTYTAMKKRISENPKYEYKYTYIKKEE